MKTYCVTVEFIGFAEYTIHANNKEELRELFDKKGSFDTIANRTKDGVNETLLLIEELTEVTK